MNTTSSASTVYPLTNTLEFFGSKMDAARFVADMLLSSELNSASITIITRGRSEDCSVLIVTDMSLEGIAVTRAQIYSLRRISI